MQPLLASAEFLEDPVLAAAGHAPAPAPFASTRQWLAQGGDARIDVDPATGFNRYFSTLAPEPRAGFGSATASSISAAAFAAADRLRDRLHAAAACEPAARTYRREIARIGHELVRLWGLDDMVGLRTLFAASGTDIHLLAAQLVASAGGAPLVAVTVEPGETGGGVPGGLSGRHFGARTALGVVVRSGAGLGGPPIADALSVAARGPDGNPRPAHEAGAELEALVTGLVPARRVLICVADVSKSGLVAPDLHTVLALARRFPDRVQVLIDACQFRLSARSLRAYLDAGTMVAVTGSKFFTGPAFCGALFAPAAVAARLSDAPLGRALTAYVSRADLPADWAPGGLAEGANLGLLLRWEAALEEMRAFCALPGWRVARFLQAFERFVAVRLAVDPAFEALPTPRPDRRALGDGDGDWDGVRTIFPFLLRDADGRHLGPDRTRAVYRALAVLPEGRVQLGQPVACGTRAGVPASALRFCASARLAVEAVTGGEAATAAVLERAAAALDRTAEAARAG